MGSYHAVDERAKAGLCMQDEIPALVGREEGISVDFSEMPLVVSNYISDSTFFWWNLSELHCGSSIDIMLNCYHGSWS